MTTAPPHAITVLIPAYQEGARIAATVRAACALPGVTRVLVIDDGSTDDTAAQAAAAGAEVLRLPCNGGKGAALRAGLAACPGAADDVLLLLDADVGATADETRKLLAPILAGEADLAIARFPRPAGKAGFGLVKGLARGGTWLLARRRLTAPISGQRACRRWVLDAAPLADGYGLEVAMNVAAGDAGARIVEVPVEMTHNATGRTLRGFAHRGRQFVHILTALLAAALGRTGEPLCAALHPGRALCWVVLLALAGWACRSWLFPPSASALLLLPCVLLGLLSAPLLAALLGARRKNYRGRFIPALGGLAWLPVVVALLAANFPGAAALAWCMQVGPGPAVLRYTLPPFLLGWLLLGLADDLWGNTERKGFRGHLRALFHGRLTTGGAKLLGGGLLALGMAWAITPVAGPRLVVMPLVALLIALSANAMNLFDLRPGRALKVYFLLAAPLLVLLHGHWAHEMAVFSDPSRWMWFFPLLALSLFTLVAVLYAPFDFADMMMLGDTGANPLGALLGVMLALLLPLPLQAVAVAALIALHLYAERASLTRLIARVRWLHWLDQLGRGEEVTG